MISFNNLLAANANDRITIDGKCYLVNGLFNSVVLYGRVPHTNLNISQENWNSLLAAYLILNPGVQNPVPPAHLPPVIAAAPIIVAEPDNLRFNWGCY